MFLSCSKNYATVFEMVRLIWSKSLKKASTIVNLTKIFLPNHLKLTSNRFKIEFTKIQNIEFENGFLLS